MHISVKELSIFYGSAPRYDVAFGANSELARLVVMVRRVWEKKRYGFGFLRGEVESCH